MRHSACKVAAWRGPCAIVLGLCVGFFTSTHFRQIRRRPPKMLGLRSTTNPTRAGSATWSAGEIQLWAEMKHVFGLKGVDSGLCVGKSS